AKYVEKTKFYYQQNNEQVFNIGVWSFFLTRPSGSNGAQVSYSERQNQPFFLGFDMIRFVSLMILVNSTPKTAHYIS
ncbi:MAG: hypothetical protein PVI74_09170, partial [Syntrophobacterales bacterium]